MIFNSFTYLVFLAIVVLFYWILPRTVRLWMLFGASIVFYGFWRWQYTPLMLVSAVVDYTVSLRLARTDRVIHRKILLLTSVLTNLGLLVYFKYLLFFAQNVASLMNLFGMDAPVPGWSIVLPLGISFYTFQTISYTVDVYRRHREPERNFVLYACFVTFFPQLVAGPILRSGEIVGQLRERPVFSSEMISSGLRRIIAGLFLKVVLADNIAALVDEGFATKTSLLEPLDVWTLAFLFGFQIYFDFSAYSHIAIGSSRLMGIRLIENFNFPYAASSPREFWKRWHISLSGWIRDYLYLPLCGVTVRSSATEGPAVSEVPPTARRRTFALFVTWAVMGFWHGAAWAFVFWGVLHATFVFGQRQLRKLNFLEFRISGIVGWAATLPLVMLAWISFRSQDLGKALEMYRIVLTPDRYLQLGLRENTYLIAALLMVLVILSYLFNIYIAPELAKRPKFKALAEIPAMTVAFVFIIPFLRPVAQFIYFQF